MVNAALTISMAPHAEPYCATMMTAPHSQPFVVARGNDPPPDRLRRAVVAIGNFDGVHRGHRVVLQAALLQAKGAGRPAAALTFEPHPRTLFQPDAHSFMLSTEAAKLRLLA